MVNAKSEKMMRKFKHTCAKAKSFFCDANRKDVMEEKTAEPKPAGGNISAATISKSVENTRRMILQKTASKNAEKDAIEKLVQNAKGDNKYEDDNFIYNSNSSSDSGFGDCQVSKIKTEVETDEKDRSVKVKTNAVMQENTNEDKIAKEKSTVQENNAARTGRVKSKKAGCPAINRESCKSVLDEKDKKDNGKLIDQTKDKNNTTNTCNSINIQIVSSTPPEECENCFENDKFKSELNIDNSTNVDCSIVESDNKKYISNRHMKSDSSNKEIIHPGEQKDDTYSLEEHMHKLDICPEASIIRDLNNLTLDLDSEAKKKKKLVYVTRGPIKRKDYNHFHQPYPEQRIVNHKIHSGGQLLVKTNSFEDGNTCYGVGGGNTFDGVEGGNTGGNVAVEDCMEEFYKSLSPSTIDFILNACCEQNPQNDSQQPIQDAYDTQQNGAYDTQQNGAYDTQQNGAYDTQQNGAYDTQQNGAHDTSWHDHQTVLPEYDVVFGGGGLLSSILTPPRSNDSHVLSPGYPTTCADGQSTSDEEPAQIVEVARKPAEQEKKKSSIHVSFFNKRMQSLTDEFKALPCCRERGEGASLLRAHLESCGPEQRRKMVLLVNRISLERLFSLLYFRALPALSDESTAAHSDVNPSSVPTPATSECVSLSALPTPATSECVSLSAVPTPAQSECVSLSAVPTPAQSECVNLSLILLAGQRLLAERPQLLLDQDYGLALLSQAAMRCARRPHVTAFLADCIRRAALEDARPNDGPIFTQTDLRGSTLCGAVARLGDSHAACLAPLVATPPGQRPLFAVDATDDEGYTALHAACLAHSARARGPGMLRVIHTLLAHGSAQLTRKANKSGDTALHLAVDSAGCELDLVLALLSHAPPDARKKLFHLHNNSQKTPMDLARYATKMRPGYPEEVLQYLKKCRN